MQEKAVGEYWLLICDEYDSHITREYINHCIDNNIILIILPLYSSYITQPLNVRVFTFIKKHIATEIDPLIQTSIPQIQKVEWLTAFIAAYN
jgi:hypothetical protein